MNPETQAESKAEVPQMTRNMKSTKPTKRIVLKILEVLKHGLVKGIGKPQPGQMCVEAAICYAYGLPHGDEPPCVGYAVRAFKVQLNDCNWSSNAARAEGMKLLAIAQLGSDALDQMAFGKLMFLRSTQTLMPFVFRREAKKLPEAKQHEMLEWADKCETVTTFEEARETARSASAYASAENDELLLLTAKVGLDVLKEMKAPGCKWLSLAKAPSVSFMRDPEAQPETLPSVPQMELLPCPFCGGEPERIEIENEPANQGGLVIQCKQCGASSPVHFGRKENLDSSWNERAQALAIPSEAEAARLVPSNEPSRGRDRV